MHGAFSFACLTVFPIAVGPLNLFITVDYTDDFNQPQVISKTITVEVMEGFLPDSGGPYPVPGEGDSGGPPIQQPETFWQKVVRFIRGMIGLRWQILSGKACTAELNSCLWIMSPSI